MLFVRSYFKDILIHSLATVFLCFPLQLPATSAAKPTAYVGSQACQPCHEREYRAFTTYAKKSSSYQSIVRLKKELTDDEIRGCYVCHTTGYGKPGGFVSEASTPHLKNAGCEVCHGPGEVHVKTQAPADIKGHPTEHDCETCHISERVRAFRYKPLIRGGAH